MVASVSNAPSVMMDAIVAPMIVKVEASSVMSDSTSQLSWATMLKGVVVVINLTLLDPISH